MDSQPGRAYWRGRHTLFDSPLPVGVPVLERVLVARDLDMPLSILVHPALGTHPHTLNGQIELLVGMPTQDDVSVRGINSPSRRLDRTLGNRRSAAVAVSPPQADNLVSTAILAFTLYLDKDPPGIRSFIDRLVGLGSSVPLLPGS